MRQERSIKNLFYGLLSFVITTIMSVVIPRLFLLSYGSEVNGLISSVKQIFAYFLLLEAGVGGAARQALYGPIAKKDKKEVTEKEEIKEEKPELDLNILTVAELRDLAKKKEIKGYSKMKKEELIENLK